MVYLCTFGDHFWTSTLYTKQCCSTYTTYTVLGLIRRLWRFCFAVYLSPMEYEHYCEQAEAILICGSAWFIFIFQLYVCQFTRCYLYSWLVSLCVFQSKLHVLCICFPVSPCVTLFTMAEMSISSHLFRVVLHSTDNYSLVYLLLPPSVILVCLLR